MIIIIEQVIRLPSKNILTSKLSKLSLMASPRAANIVSEVYADSTASKVASGTK